jgi:hypothetical protein
MSVPKSSICIVAMMVVSLTGCAQFSQPDIGAATFRSQTPETSPTGTQQVTQASFTSDAVSCADEDAACSADVEIGRRNAVVDGVGWVIGIPQKLLLWDRRALNHDVSDQTVGVVREYIRDNDLQDVKVRVNQYDPGGEWKRLTTNKAVSPLWRYTLGTLSTVHYTVFPGRVFGHDGYNPFTNTISIYSDIPSVAVHEAAYAADNHRQELRGTYGAGQQLPLVNIWHEAQATRLAHGWLKHGSSGRFHSESQRILPPLCGIRVAGSLNSLTPDGGASLTILGAAMGHVVGMGMNSQDSAKSIASQTDSGIRTVNYETETTYD